ncbi:hypothetical protein C6401_04845 [Arthrobacter woluwensis]|uniref:WXG100 family type VII secretion target n=1 Tax=Arthrobacter woluwensis TaxID=156980 RepID=UPI000D115838|nr:hypothetical protein [Arthrobacter woluwensis]PSS45411.1 hypothetical protein C6401_04845 [Arthrobacter woluwensis]
MFYGADVSALRALAKLMKQSDRAIAVVESHVTSALSAVVWKGPDGDAFRKEWTGQLRPALRHTSQALQREGAALQRHAQEQEDASRSGGASSGTGGSSGGGGGGGSSAGYGDDHPYRLSDWFNAYTDPDYQNAPSTIEWLIDQITPGDGEGLATLVESLRAGWDGSALPPEVFNEIKKASTEIDTLVKEAAETAPSILKPISKWVPVLDVVLAVGDGVLAVQHQDPMALQSAWRDVQLGIASSILEISGAGALFGLGVDTVGLIASIAESALGKPLPQWSYDVNVEAIPGLREIPQALQDWTREHIDPLVNPELARG